VFSSTLYKDSNWIYLKEYFKNKGIELEGHTSLFEDGVDHIDQLITELNEQAKEEEEEKKQQDEPNNVDALYAKMSHMGIGNWLDDETEAKKVKRKKKYIEPEYIIVFE
jgi:hypothetical protein